VDGSASPRIDQTQHATLAQGEILPPLFTAWSTSRGQGEVVWRFVHQRCPGKIQLMHRQIDGAFGLGQVYSIG
jgi:hypothetical protein